MSLNTVNPDLSIRSDPLYEEGETYDYDYSHILPEELRQGGYSLEVSDDDCGHVQGNVSYDDGARKTLIGNLSGFMKHDALHSQYAKVDPLHRNRGLATAAHEAMIIHAKNELGATHLAGELHGSFSPVAHAQIAQKHNMLHRPNRIVKTELELLVGLDSKFSATPLFKNDDPLMERIKHGSVEERTMAIKDPGITSDHLAQAAKDRSKTVQQAVLEHDLCTPEFIAHRAPDIFIKNLITDIVSSTRSYEGDLPDPHGILAQCNSKMESVDAIKRIWSVVKEMEVEDFPGRDNWTKKSNRTSTLRRLSKIYLTPREVLEQFPMDDPDYDDSTRRALLQHPNADPARVEKMHTAFVDNLLLVEKFLEKDHAYTRTVAAGQHAEKPTDEERAAKNVAQKSVERFYRQFREALDDGSVPMNLVERLASIEETSPFLYPELERAVNKAQASPKLGPELVNKIFLNRLDQEENGPSWDGWGGFLQNPHITPEHLNRMLDSPKAARHALTTQTLATPELAQKVLKLLSAPDAEDELLNAVSTMDWPTDFHGKVMNLVAESYVPHITNRLLRKEAKLESALQEARNDVSYYDREVTENPGNSEYRRYAEDYRAKLAQLEAQPILSSDQIRKIHANITAQNDRIRELKARVDRDETLTPQEEVALNRGHVTAWQYLKKLPNTPPDIKSALIKDSLISGKDDVEYSDFATLTDPDKVEVLEKATNGALVHIIDYNRKAAIPEEGWNKVMARLPAAIDDEYGHAAELEKAISKSATLPLRIVESLANKTNSYTVFSNLYDPAKHVITQPMLDIMRERAARNDTLVQNGGWVAGFERILDPDKYTEGGLNPVSPVNAAFLDGLYDSNPDLTAQTIAGSAMTHSSLLERIIDTDRDSNTIRYAFRNPNLSADYFDRAIAAPMPPAKLNAILANDTKLSPERVAKLIERNPLLRYVSEDSDEFQALAGNNLEKKSRRTEIRLYNEAVMNLVDHPNVPSEWIDKQLSFIHPDDKDEFAEKLREKMAEDRPSALFGNQTVKVKLGSQKLRVLRDLILDSGNKLVPMSELPQGNWEKFRVITGDPKIDRQKLVSAEKIQQAIDAIPEQTFHYHEREWDHELQMHRNDIPSSVFQVQLGDDHMKKIKAHGLWGNWRTTRDSTISGGSVHPPYESGPAIAKSALGWMRFTGDPEETGTLHGEEVQCDYRTHGSNSSSAQIKDAILGALFGEMDPHEVIMEVHAQHLRDKGMSHVVVHYPALEFRAALHPIQGFAPRGAVQPGALPPPASLQIRSEKAGRLAHAHAKNRETLVAQIAQLEEQAKADANPKQKAIVMNKLQGSKKTLKEMMGGFLKDMRLLTNRVKLGILPTRGVRFRNTADKICQAVVSSHSALTNLKNFDLDGLRAEHKDLLAKLATEADPKTKRTMEGKANAMHRTITQHPANIKQLESNHAENLSSLHDLLRIDPDLKNNISGIFERKPMVHYTETYEDIPNAWSMTPAKYGDEPSETNTNKFGGFAMWKYKVRKFEEVEDNLHKSLKTIPDGKILNNNGQVAMVDYSHVLPPELKKDGYGLRIKVVNLGRRIGSGGDGMSITADITHQSGKFVGGATGQVASKPNGERHLDIDLSDVEDAHQGKGLGLAAYEAMMAFSHNVLKATHVTGGEHSSLVSKLHSRLAQKHGMEYVPQPNFPSNGFANQEAWEAKAPGPYDAKYAGYKYLLKADLSEITRPSTMEEPEIQAADVVEGPFVEKSYDYSHLLPENPDKSYKIIVQRRKKSFGPAFGLEAYLKYKGQDVGSVAGVVRPSNATMYLADAELDENHRGRGMGKALYKALYAHAANDLKVKSVDGESHSDSARAVHESLAREYGFSYSAKRNIGPEGYIDSDTWRGNANRPFNGRWGKYDYDLKPTD